MEWQVISPSAADQVPLSLLSCTVCAKLISLSFLYFLLDILISATHCGIHCDIFLPSTLYFPALIYLFLSPFCLLLMSFVGIVLRGVIAGATDAAQSSQAHPNRHLECPQGANGNMSLELSFNRRLAVSALMFLFDGLLGCIMGGGGCGEVLRGLV